MRKFVSGSAYTIFKGYSHGVILKLFGVLSKVVFLFVVVQTLDEGVFSSFFVILTGGTIIARILSLGSEEQIPLEGGTDQLGQYLPLYIFLLALSSFAFGLVIFFSSVFTHLLLIALVFSQTFVFIGVLRVYGPRYYEWLTELPWVLFLLFNFIIDLRTLDALILFFSLSYVLTGVFVFLAAGVLRLSLIVDVFSILLLAKRGGDKVLSNLIVVMNLRALVIWATLFGYGVSDRLTLAIGCGEAVWQFCTVVVFRNYSTYCTVGPVFLRSLYTGGFFIVMGVLVAFLLYFLQGTDVLPILPKVDWGYVAAAVVCYSLYGAFYEMRYYYWSVGISRFVIIGCGLALFSLVAIPVYLLPELYWMIGCILLACLFYIGWLISTFVTWKMNGSESR